MRIRNFIYGTLCSIGVLFALNGCASSSNAQNKESEKMEKSFTITEMQELTAMKATKFINENNPIVLHKFTADPAVLVYKDTVYVYGTNDMQQLEYNKGKSNNGYGQINSLNVFSSKDLVNWTDCGTIAVAGRDGAAKWARNSWAPAVCWKNINGKDKFFIYFADSANGIGVISADSPLGPFEDPRGSALISRQTPNTQGVYWLFDPAVLIDDDGTGYLYYGGGHQDKTPEDISNPKSARCVRLTDDMIEIDMKPVQIEPPFLFEDSGINKINGKYYYSYCTNWADRKNFPDADPAAVIGYMVSDDPLGPFEYKGYTLKNPGVYFGAYGNNHHWIFQFKDKWYIAYHAQFTEKALGLKTADGKEAGGYRSIIISDFKINDDGSLPIQSATKTGVEATQNFNPYEKVPAATMHSSKKIAVNDLKEGVVGATITQQQKIIPVEDGAYVALKNVDFSEGASSITIKTAAGSGEGTLKMFADQANSGELMAEIAIKGDGTFEAPVTLPAGDKVRNVYFTFKGNFALVEWKINK